MSFDEFQNQARLYVVGALDETELEAFHIARESFGEEAEDFLQECRHLSSVFALSLQPSPPAVTSRRDLMERIRRAGGRPQR